MPKKPKFPLKRRGKNNLTADQEFFLLHGFCLDGFQPDYGHTRASSLWHVPFRNEQTMLDAWVKNKDYLIAKVSEPFRRPWAFWQFLEIPRQSFNQWYGFRDKGWAYNPSLENLHDVKPAVVQESKRDYLIRCDLLTRSERETIQMEEKIHKE